MELKNAWIVVEGREAYGGWMRISWEILDEGGLVAVSGTVAAPPAPGDGRMAWTNGDGAVDVECVTPAMIRIGVDDGGDAGPFLPRRVFVMGASDAAGPLVMASVLDWPAGTPLTPGMVMITLDTVGGVTPERGECVPGSDDPPSGPGKPGAPRIHPSEG